MVADYQSYDAPLPLSPPEIHGISRAGPVADIDLRYQYLQNRHFAHNR
ncbi:MAG: hypothetical protein GY845_25000 [Planctomycetes bacterium]|nr:hypothetical protein [Planctomycetota bacterium]